MLKILIYIVLFLLVLSLASGLFFLLVDQGKPDKKRTAYSLGLRVILAIILIVLVTIGLSTGQLGNTVPWE
jgi:uncharacterized membrane protein